MQTSNFKKLAAYILLFVVAACAPSEKPFTGVKIGKPYEINGKTYVPTPESSYDKIGDGSWYGPGFHGRKTASGEIFNEDDLTAAHPTLPLPSLVRVTNLSNNKSVVVRVNDRGPFHKNRIIDLSKGSAQAIDMKSTKPVRVQFLKEETDEYINSVMGKSPKIDMVAYNEEYNKKIKEKNDAVAEQIAGGYTMSATNYNTTSARSEEIEDSAPLQSVAINDLEQPTKPEKIISSSKNAIIRQARIGEEVHLTSDDSPETVEISEQKVTANNSKAAPLKQVKTEATNAKTTAEKTLPKDNKSKGKYIILAGSFAAKENADKLVKSLSSIPDHKKLISVDKVNSGGKDWWRVHIGTFADKAKAEKILDIVQNAGVKDAILKSK